ncbi:MAG: YncE family protein [Alphaproteobacteria bacterium]
MRRLLSLGLAIGLGIIPAAMAKTPPAYRVASKIALPDGGWDLASFDPVMRRAYITRSDGVTAIDADSGNVIGKLTPANRGHATLVLKNGAEILVTDGGSDTAVIYDAKTGAELATIKTGANPDAAMYDPASGLAVVMNAKGGSLTLIDPKTRASVGEIAIGGSLELGATDGSARVFINVEDRNDLVVVDLKTKKLLTRIPLTGCDGPTGLAYLKVSKRLLSSCANGVAVITNPATMKAESTLPIGAGPDTVMYDTQRKLAFIPAGRAGELDIFTDDAKGVHPAGKLATQLGARTGTLDEKTGRIYLPAADYLPPAAAGGRPQMKPGSVVAVVVEPSKP